VPQAPAADQARLLDVQDVDTRAQQAQHRLASLPVRAELAALEAQASELNAERVDAQTAVLDLKREVTKAEDDVQTVRARAERDNARLMAGGMTPRDLEALQGELTALAKRQSDLEDIELDAMQRLEEAEAAAAGATDKATALAVAIEEAKGRLATEAEAIEVELQGLATERFLAVKGVDESLMALYERLREQNGGIGAAALSRGACQGCHMNLNPGDLAAIESRSADDIVRCEECGRILVRGTGK